MLINIIITTTLIAASWALKPYPSTRPLTVATMTAQSRLNNTLLNEALGIIFDIFKLGSAKIIPFKMLDYVDSLCNLIPAMCVVILVMLASTLFYETENVQLKLLP